MTERKTLESERAELVALAGRIEQAGTIEIVDSDLIDRNFDANAREMIVTALRRLAAQDQKPAAYQLRVRDGSYCRIIPDGELEVWKSNWTNHLNSGHAEIIPLAPIGFPPPAAGWDDAIEAAKLVVERWSLPTIQTPSMWLIDKAGIVAEIEALRHNAPPDTGAGKSSDINEATGYAERLAVALWEKHYKTEADQWRPLSGDLIGILTQIDNMTTGLARVPDHGGADAGVIDARWRTELDEIVSHLGAAITQSVASDDQIIMDHVKAAHEIAKVVRRQA